MTPARPHGAPRGRRRRLGSNLPVAVAATVLARDPEADRPRWRVVRVAALAGITVTGVVHLLLLRPLLTLYGGLDRRLRPAPGESSAPRSRSSPLERPR